MRWPWQSNLETRADSSYTDALIAAITANAKGQSTAFPNATGALEACAGLVGRAFATALVKTSSSAAMRALTPSCLALVGRALIRRGEIVLYIDTTTGMLNLLPCQSHDVDGGPIPATWEYRCTVSGPERTFTYEATPAEGVIHLTYAREPETPWRGIGPLQAAQLTGRLAAETAAALADESSGPRGHLLGIPVDGAGPLPLPSYAKTCGTWAGKIGLIETKDWGGAAGGGEVVLKPEPPRAGTYGGAGRAIQAVGGIRVRRLRDWIPALLTDAQGTAKREAYRQFLFGTVAPLGRMVAAELTEKLNTPVMLDWDELRASDIAGRARAFGVMASNGMDLERAAGLSGLLTAE